VNIQNPGIYKILIDASPHSDDMFDTVITPPDSFTRPYTLKVSQ
jgi:hypothetical protein